MPSSLIALVLAGTLALGPTAGTGSAAPRAGEAARAAEPTKVRLDVDTSALEDDEAVGELIAKAVAARLEKDGIAVDGAQALTIRIVVRRFSPKAVADFFVDVEILRDGELVEQLETSGCAKCIDDFLIAHVVERVPEIEERVRAAQESATPSAGTTSPAVGETEAASPAPTDAEPQREPSDPEGSKRDVAFIAGGAVGCAVGLGTLFAGVLVRADGASVTGSSSQPQQLEGTDRRGLGYTLIGAGTAVVAAGIGFIVVGSLQRGKARRSQASLAPAVGSSTWGLSVAGRF